MNSTGIKLAVGALCLLQVEQKLGEREKKHAGKVSIKRSNANRSKLNATEIRII